MKFRHLFTILTCLLSVSLSGCLSTSGNDGSMQSYLYAVVEPEWIRNGEPLVFEDKPWYPKDGVEIFTDAEMYLVGEYRGVQFFSDRTDVRPFDRLYTKFGRNKFRYFVK